MSLYFDAASVLTDTARGGSLKSRIYNPNPKTKQQKTKAPPAQIYALIVESAKWDTVLKEVIDKAGVLAAEPKVCLPFHLHSPTTQYITTLKLSYEAN